MITETIEYKDLDKQTRTKTLHFHISADRLTEHMTMLTKLEELGKILEGPKRELKPEETQKMIDVVKFFIDIAYGERLDSDEFDNSPEALAKFKRSQAYSAFLLSLFKEPEKSMNFVNNVLPMDIAEQLGKGDMTLEQMAAEAGLDIPASALQGIQSAGEDVPVAPPQLSAVPNQSSTDEPDFDAMLREAESEAATPTDPNEGKTPITQQQYDVMKQKLSAKPDMFEKFMSTRYVAD